MMPSCCWGLIMIVVCLFCSYLPYSANDHITTQVTQSWISPTTHISFNWFIDLPTNHFCLLDELNPFAAFMSSSTPVQPWEESVQYVEMREKLISETKSRTGYTPKAVQVRFAMALIFRKDVTCVAATGFGKSLAFQMALFMLPKKLGIVVSPIEALGQDQVEACKKIGLNALALHEGDLESQPNLLKDIMRSKYNIRE